MNNPLAQRLVEMVEEDRRMRAELAATGELFQGYAPRMAEVHRRNGQELEAIIEEFGWPGKTLAGEQGAQAAWFILQHAIGDPALQRRCLPLLQAAVARNDADPLQAAYLEDRICFFERRPQQYGTQFDWDEHGQMSPWTLADPARVDEYRAAVGLGPLAERVKEVRRATAGPPPDYHERQKEMLAWARAVGWL